MHFIWLKFRIEIFEILPIQPNYLLLLKIFCMLQWYHWLNFQQIRFNKSGPIKAYFTSKIAVQWILAFLFKFCFFYCLLNFSCPVPKLLEFFRGKLKKSFPQQFHRDHNNSLALTAFPLNFRNQISKSRFLKSVHTQVSSGLFVLQPNCL